jgi:hypothetical protein
MRTVRWTLEVGLQGCDRSGEVEVPSDASDEEIEVIVREDIFNFISWGWE